MYGAYITYVHPCHKTVQFGQERASGSNRNMPLDLEKLISMTPYEKINLLHQILYTIYTHYTRIFRFKSSFLGAILGVEISRQSCNQC